jgi:shikimate kinase
VANGPDKHILLIGLRGSGKSTIATRLGERLQRNAIDLDPEVLRELGCADVTEAWDKLGEHAFREAETLVLGRLLEREEPMVLALGGGTPTAPGAEDLIAAATSRGRAIVMYLAASAATLAARLPAEDRDRPSLTGRDARDEMAYVLQARDGLYRALADHVVDAEGDEATVLAHACAALAMPT